MERFNVKCPDHYPMKCNLSPSDKDYLLSQEKYKAFFIYQYKNQDPWLKTTLDRYFAERTWRLFDAGREGGTGTKFCNVCRYALASDFGIASLTPFNYNVYQEVGLMQGLQKQILYIVNPKWLDDSQKLPFDMDDQIYVEHKNEGELIAGLDLKIPLVLDKVELLTGFETDKRAYIKKKLQNLSEPALGILKVLIFEGPMKFYSREDLLRWVKGHNLNSAALGELFQEKFIITEITSGGTRTMSFEWLNQNYIGYLEELLWE